MNGFDYIKVCITESINRGSRRKYITPDEALKSARRRSREMGLDPDKIKQEADEVICLLTPEFFLGVGGFYQEFAQTEDQEVERLLRELRP